MEIRAWYVTGAGKHARCKKIGEGFMRGLLTATKPPVGISRLSVLDQELITVQKIVSKKA